MLNCKKTKGQSLVEYGLILALVAIVCMGSLGQLAGGIQGTLGTVTTAMNGGGNSPPILGDPGQQMMGGPPAI